MQSADVVIIGGGIVGSSIAYHLTEQGCRSVIVIEREAHQGKGSTGKSMGGVRAQFSTPVNIQMSMYSIPFYASFPVQVPDSDEFQGDCTSFGYKYDSSGRLQIESKKDLKKRSMKSPDTFESLMLTFAVGDYVNTTSYKPIRLPDYTAGMFT